MTSTPTRADLDTLIWDLCNCAILSQNPNDLRRRMRKILRAWLKAHR
jgi:hypothetical protein